MDCVTAYIVCDDRQVIYESCRSRGIHSFNIRIHSYDILKN